MKGSDMNFHLPFAAALLAVALASPALADKDKGNRGKHWKSQHHAQAWCPPGLAKKSPACIPPGPSFPSRLSCVPRSISEPPWPNRPCMP
jgi:hypothetical protein